MVIPHAVCLFICILILKQRFLNFNLELLSLTYGAYANSCVLPWTLLGNAFQYFLQKASLLKKTVNATVLISEVLRLFREEDFSLVVFSECSFNYYKCFQNKCFSLFHVFFYNTNCSFTLSCLAIVYSW